MNATLRRLVSEYGMAGVLGGLVLAAEREIRELEERHNDEDSEKIATLQRGMEAIFDAMSVQRGMQR